MRVKFDLTILLLGISLAGLTTGCKKKVAVAPPPPPPVQQELPPPAPLVPTASITAEPAVVESGQSVTLKWFSTNATEVTISGLGTVSAEGRQEVRPAIATTYELVAKGPGGSATASATVDVTMPPPPIIKPAQVESKSLPERIESELADAYFDYDKSDVREDAGAVLAKDAEALRSILTDFPDAAIVIEGHCDERGSAEYNIGLGDRRTASAIVYLETIGVDAGRLRTVSYGKERPQCTEATETCWQKNRRVHFAAGAAATRTN